MTKATILFADNDQEFLKTRCEFLEQEGYDVISAHKPASALQLIAEQDVDLAILDLRLINDDDEKDLSGLNIARDSAPSVPKIILTKFPGYEQVRAALGPALNGLPVAVDFVAKQEGPQTLLTAIRRVLGPMSNFQKKTARLSDQIRRDYEDARQQAKVNFWASLGVSAVGMVILFAGIGLALSGVVGVGIVSALAGLVAEGVSLLFFKRADSANNRMDKYHLELLETRRFENLLTACDELLSSERQNHSKETVIEAASKKWLADSNIVSQSELAGGEA